MNFLSRIVLCVSTGLFLSSKGVWAANSWNDKLVEMLENKAADCGVECRTACGAVTQAMRDGVANQIDMPSLIEACESAVENDPSLSVVDRISFRAPLSSIKSNAQYAATAVADANQTQSAVNQNTTAGGELNIDALLQDAPDDTAAGSDDFDQVVARIVGDDPASLPTFAEAQDALKVYPEFVDLKAEVNGTKYTLTQLRTAYDRLLPKRAEMNSNDWRRQIDQLAAIISKKELVEAVTQPCSMEYLETFNEDRRWQHTCRNPLHLAKSNDPQVRAFSAPCGERPLQFRVEAPFLQRLCVRELKAEVQRRLSGASSPENLAELSDRYLSRPVLAGGIGTMGGEPARIMSNAQWLPEIYAHQEEVAAGFERRKGDEDFQRALIAGLERTGISTWVRDEPNQVQGALRYYEAVARGASFGLDASRRYGQELVLNRAKAYEAKSLIAVYMPPQYNFNAPKYAQVKVLSSIACAGLPGQLRALIEQPKTLSAQDFAELQFRRRACDTDVVRLDSRRLEREYSDYATALSINSSEGQRIAGELRSAGDERLRIQQAFTQKVTGVFGYGFDDMFGALQLIKQLDQLDTVMRNSAYPQPSGDFPEMIAQVAIYYEEVTELNFDDRAAAIAAQQTEQQRKQQELFLARQTGNTPAQSTQSPPTDVALVSAYFGNQCLGWNSLPIDCACVGKLYGERAVSGAFSNENEVYRSDASQCLDRAKIEEGQFAVCSQMRSSNCECVSTFMAENATYPPVDRSLAQTAARSCAP